MASAILPAAVPVILASAGDVKTPVRSRTRDIPMFSKTAARAETRFLIYSPVMTYLMLTTPYTAVAILCRISSAIVYPFIHPRMSKKRILSIPVSANTAVTSRINFTAEEIYLSKLSLKSKKAVFTVPAMPKPVNTFRMPSYAIYVLYTPKSAVERRRVKTGSVKNGIPFIRIFPMAYHRPAFTPL